MPTFNLIEAKTLASAVNSITFTSIPQTYTDLKVLVCARSAQTGTTRENIIIGFNSQLSDTGFTWIGMYGYISGTGTNKSPAAYRIIGDIPAADTTANTFSNAEIYIPSYTSVTPHTFIGESVVEDNTDPGGFLSFGGVLWSAGSEAITSVTVFCGAGSQQFTANSTFYLYGIKNS
jgi:hypothetical protein